MIFMFPILTFLTKQTLDPQYRVHVTELKAIQLLIKNENYKPTKKNDKVCVIVHYHDPAFVPIDARYFDFIAIVSNGTHNNKLNVKYVSFGKDDTTSTSMKNRLVGIDSKPLNPQVDKIKQFDIPKPKEWDDEKVFNDLANSSIKKNREHNYLIDGGDMFYLGFQSGNKCVATFGWEQTENGWKKAKELVMPIKNAIYEFEFK